MTTFTRVIPVVDCDDNDLIKRKMPSLEHYRFILELNDELCSILPEKLHTYFTPKTLLRTAKNLFSQIVIRGLDVENITRVNTSESRHIIQSLSKKSDPSIQILKENLSLEVFNNISTLICTKNLDTPPSSLFTIKLQLSC